jgi:Protein of unknown function (DUF4232)
MSRFSRPRLSRRTAAAAAAVVALGAGSAAVAATSASAATGHPAATTRLGIIPRCTPGDLAVWVNANSADGTAGTTYYHLDYTNISRGWCHLYSWPGVTAANAAGKQLGAAAVRSGIAPAAYVNIAPGGTAHSILGYVDVQISKACKPALATHLKVYPPDDSAARDAFFAASVCTDKTKDLVVWRVQPGA